MFASSTHPVERGVSDTGTVRRIRSGGVRRLTRGETLFHAGDRRGQLFRVERGALCHYLRLDNGQHEVIEFAFPGDIIGFGHLAEHATTAQAVAKTIVSPISDEEFERLLEIDGQLAARFAAAGDREFDFMRARSIGGNHGKPAKRVASFLAAMSRLSADEGRDPNVITDEFSSGVVAEHLNMSLDALASILRELEAQGMVAEADKGLRIVDIEALETFADAA
jgi:CRP/FNR family transcriptional regulator, anaerobic regulatory protein